MRICLIIMLIAIGGCSSLRVKESVRKEIQPIAVQESVIESEEGKTTVEKIRRKLPWNRAREPLSPTNLKILNEFLEKNELELVEVKIQQETPKEDWKKLQENESVNPLIKYSLGSINWVESVVVRPSFWGINRYDPFTNTLHINSNDPVAILEELSTAKIIKSKKNPGAYALASKIPFISIYTQKQKTNEVIAYAKETQDWELEKATYRQMYPKILDGSDMVASLFASFYIGPAITLTGVTIGYAAAEWEIAQREPEVVSRLNLTKPKETISKSEEEIERAYLPR